MSAMMTTGTMVRSLHASSEWREDDCNGWGLYRQLTWKLLRRYFRMSLDLGRVPSLLGGELFRARVTSYKAHCLEDVVIFVHDVERCLERLSSKSQKVIALVAFQDYRHEEVARAWGITRRQVISNVTAALDELSAELVERRLIEPLHGRDGLPPKKRPVSVRGA